MPKFHVVCEKQYYKHTVVLEVNAKSAAHARRKVEDSPDPEADFPEVGLRDPETEILVSHVKEAT